MLRHDIDPCRNVMKCNLENMLPSNSIFSLDFPNSKALSYFLSVEKVTNKQQKWYFIKVVPCWEAYFCYGFPFAKVVLRMKYHFKFLTDLSMFQFVASQIEFWPSDTRP